MLREIASTVEMAVPLMTFEDQRRILEILRVRVEVIDKETVQLHGLLTGSVVDISPSRSVCNGFMDIHFEVPITLVLLA
jgi:hypothetical protein